MSVLFIQILDYFIQDPLRILTLLGGSGGLVFWISLLRNRPRLRIAIVDKGLLGHGQQVTTLTFEAENVGNMPTSLKPDIMLSCHIPSIMLENIRPKMHIWGERGVQKKIFRDELAAYEIKGWRDHPNKLGLPLEEVNEKVKNEMCRQGKAQKRRYSYTIGTTDRYLPPHVPKRFDAPCGRNDDMMPFAWYMTYTFQLTRGRAYKVRFRSADDECLPSWKFYWELIRFKRIGDVPAEMKKK